MLPCDRFSACKGVANTESANAHTLCQQMGLITSTLLLLQDIQSVGLELELRQLVKAYNGSLGTAAR